MAYRRRHKFAAEFIGTATLVFIGPGAAATGLGGLVGVALAFGFIVAGCIYAYGPISGCHINPAVTAGFWWRGDITDREALGYVGAQAAGGLVGAFMIGVFLGFGTTDYGATLPATALEIRGGEVLAFSWAGVFIVELVCTFLLMSAILHATADDAEGPFAPLAIALTLIALIMLAGPLTGGAFNPARTLGPAVMSGEFAAFPIYMIAPPIGAVLAVAAEDLLGRR